MFAFFSFALRHVAALVMMAAAAVGAGAWVLGRRGSFALRGAVGLGVCAYVLFFVALAGLLRPPVIVALALGAWAGLVRVHVWPRIHVTSWMVVAAIWFAMLFFIALRPPLAFDETLYHLPFVRALATDGALRFHGDFRFPVFPQLHELLCAPLFLGFGDAATHLVALLELAITAALTAEWARHRGVRGSGVLAAALFAGSPIVMHLGVITYTDAALAMFVTAGGYCIDRADGSDRRWLALAGFLLGTACGVKYLGGFFAVAALAVVVMRTRQVRAIRTFAPTCFAAAAPTSVWLTITAHDPLFPFVRPSIWSLMPEHVPLATHIARVVRLAWDVTFARDRVGSLPPHTPFVIPLLLVVAFAAVRDRRARVVAAITVVYAVVFTFLPQDARYLVPLLPMLCVVAAMEIASRWPQHVASLAIVAALPGLLYAGYAIVARGLPPATPDARTAWLAQRVPEYAALLRAGEETVYVCGAEQLKYYARGTLLGDFAGPYAYDRVLPPAQRTTSVIAASLRRIGATELLVAKRTCNAPVDDGGMQLVYDDAAAQLWRVQRSQSSP